MIYNCCDLGIASSPSGLIEIGGFIHLKVKT